MANSVFVLFSNASPFSAITRIGWYLSPYLKQAVPRVLTARLGGTFLDQQPGQRSESLALTALKNLPVVDASMPVVQPFRAEIALGFGNEAAEFLLNTLPGTFGKIVAVIPHPFEETPGVDYSRFDKIVVFTKSMYSYFINKGVSANKVQVVQPFVNPERLAKLTFPFGVEEGEDYSATWLFTVSKKPLRGQDKFTELLQWLDPAIRIAKIQQKPVYPFLRTALGFVSLPEVKGLNLLPLEAAYFNKPSVGLRCLGGGHEVLEMLGLPVGRTVKDVAEMLFWTNYSYPLVPNLRSKVPTTTEVDLWL
jgi:hypothetical protein